MNYKLIVIILSSICINYTFAQNTNNFDALLENVWSSPQELRNDLVTAYISELGQTPFIEDSTIIFLVKNDLVKAPLILADFNGYLRTRYVKDSSLGKMKTIDGTGWYYLKKDVRRDAVINYQIKLGEEVIVDPNNPNKQMLWGEMVSYIEMTDHTFTNDTKYPQNLAKGTVEELSITSKYLGHNRTVHIYTPANYQRSEQGLPSLYFHDGSLLVDEMHAPEILDLLIASDKIDPVIAVFDDPVNRGKEYRADSAYFNYFQHELIPFVDKNYSTIPNPGARTVLGFSRGGMSSLYLAFLTEEFGKCGVFSPAIHPTSVSEFTGKLNRGNSKPSQVYITGSVYDYVWYKDALALKSSLGTDSITLHYDEISGGHNIPTWKTQLGDMLTTLLK